MTERGCQKRDSPASAAELPGNTCAIPLLRKRYAPEYRGRLKVHRDTLLYVLETMVPAPLFQSAPDRAGSESEEVEPADICPSDSDSDGSEDWRLASKRSCSGGGPHSKRRRRRSVRRPTWSMTAGMVQPDVTRPCDLPAQLCRAAQHSASSGRPDDMLDALLALVPLTPRLTRLCWELALSVSVAADGGSTLPDVVPRFVMHSALGRPAAFMAAITALATVGNRAEALRVAAGSSGSSSCSGSGSASQLGRQQTGTGAVLEMMRALANVLQGTASGGAAYYLKMLQSRLQSLLTDRTQRLALAPLLAAVNSRLEEEEKAAAATVSPFPASGRLVGHVKASKSDSRKGQKRKRTTLAQEEDWLASGELH